MPSAHDILTEQFRQWELRGRGWKVFDQPVHPEPPFTPFEGHYFPKTPIADDGRRPTLLSTLVQGLSRKLNTKPPAPPMLPEPEEEPEPTPIARDELVELQVSLPPDLDVPAAAVEQFLTNLSLCREPVSFEILGIPNRVTVQFAAHPQDAANVRRQLQAHFPDASFQMREGVLEQAWVESEGDEALAVEFGLAHEFMFPLAIGNADFFVGLIGALSELQPGELGLFQVLFQPVSHPWAASITRSVTHSDGKPFFVNEPQLVKAAQNKVSSPLFAAVVRIAVKGKTYEDALQIAQSLAASLRVFANPQSNELIPLENTDYPFEQHIEDVIRRQSRRCGMLLNSNELVGFVHLPSSDVRSPVLARQTGKTKAAPASVRGDKGVLLGINIHADESTQVRLTPDQRVQHTHIIGASGTGKSTLLYNLITQDIQNGEGVAVLDPHGDLIDKILGSIPPERVEDVVLVDPSDEQFSVGFNILSAHSDLEKNLLASDLVSVFQRLSTSWGDQMGSVLQNAILAFLESDRGGTLADLQKFLLEPAFREQFLKTVRDEAVVYYWKKGFTQLSGNKSIGPVLTRLGTFLSPKPIRYMVSQQQNRLDFGQILDSGKIFLAKLPQGQMGKENAFLLGSLLVAKFQQLAMSRQAQRISARKDFWLYIDEFQNFITPSMTEILTGARKYRLGLILAHQELRQLERDRDVASAVLSNPYTRVVFRVGDADARALENGFSFFESKDLQNLERGRAVCRIEKADGDFNLTIPPPENLDAQTTDATRQAVIAASRTKYATSRAEIEAALLVKLNTQTVTEPPPKSTPAPVRKDSEQKDAEVRKETVSEREIVPVEAAPTPPVALPIQAPAVEKPQPAKPILDERGIGGNQHNLIRERIEFVARELGYHAAREKQTATGQKIDLALEKQSRVIACEISVFNTVDYEVGNVAKCLKAGCWHIAVICGDDSRLGKIRKAVSGCMSAEDLTRVGYYLPDQFIDHLKSLKLPQVATTGTPIEIKLGKYKITRRGPTLTPDEIREREDITHKVLAETMRPKS